MFRNRPVSLALVGLFVWVTGCTSYKQIEIGEVADHGEVRVTFADGERIVLQEVTVEGDSIYYWNKAEQPANYSAVRVSSPLDQVVEVEASGASSVSTVFVVLAGAFVVATLICAAACEFPFED